MLFLVSFTTIAQVQVSLSQETINTTFKTKQNGLDASAHYHLRVGMISNGEIKIGVNIESMEDAYFRSFSFDLGRRLFIGQNIEVIPAMEFGLIDRDFDGFFFYGANVEFDYFINDHIGIMLVIKANNRKDFDRLNEIYYNTTDAKHYSANVFIGIVYKFNNPANTKH